MPEVMITDTYQRAQREYDGTPSNARGKLAFFHLRQVDLEWMEPVDEPSTWYDQRDEHGHCLHQIAFEVKGMQEGAVYLKAKELSSL